MLLALGARLTWQASPAMTLGLFGVMVIESLLPPLQLALTAITIDSIIAGIDADQPVNSWATRLEPSAWIMLTAVTILVGQVMDPLRSFLQSMLGDRTTFLVGDRLLEVTNTWHGAARFENPATADDLTNASSRAANAGNDLLMQAGPMAPTLFTVVTLALTLGAVHPLVPLLVVAASIPHMLSVYAFMDKVFTHLAWQTPDARRLFDTRDMPIRPDLARDVRLFELGNRIYDRYERIWSETTESLNEVRSQMLRDQVAWSALKYGVSALVVLLVIWRASRGEISIGQVTLFTGAVYLLGARLQELGAMIGFVPRILAFLPALQRVLDAPPDLDVPDAPACLALPLTTGFAFHNVSFAYPGTDRLVLDDVSFTLNPGESVALVGHNGAGKTTIVKLMLRLYDPDSGSITLNGIDLRSYDPAAFRRACSVIFQDFGRYDFTARENIALGDVDTPRDNGDLMTAATKAGADSVIDGLPDGLDTMLGLRFGGRDLSGGEWQRIALARAFVRDAPVLILDEPTAALDVRAEYEVYQRFADLTRDRATMLISHRFSTVRMADRILVLDGARIVERGTHDELIRQHGVYQRLYTAQARHYVDAIGEVQ